MNQKSWRVAAIRGGRPRPTQLGAPKLPSPRRLHRDRNWGARRPARDRKRKRGAVPWKKPRVVAAWGVPSSPGTGFTWYVWPRGEGPDSERGGQSGASGRRPGRDTGREHFQARALASPRPSVPSRSPVSSPGLFPQVGPKLVFSRLRAPPPTPH